MKLFGNRSARAALVVSALTAIAGCASMGSKTPEQLVQQRAEAYWKARQGADVKAAYALLTPAYRGLRDEQAFRQQFGAGSPILASKVDKVTCEAEKCTARVALTAKPSIPGLNLPSITTYMDDTWLLVDGQWWRHETP